MNLDPLERLWTNVQLLSHGCILCKYERVKSSPSQQAYKEKKDSMYGMHLCSFPRTILLPFGLHNSQKYPQHPLVASKRKSTNRTYPAREKKSMQSSILQQQTNYHYKSITSFWFGFVKNAEKERDCRNQVSPPYQGTFFSLIRVINLSSLSIP